MSGSSTPQGPIALIGLGLMGSELAATLIRGGFEVRGFDVSGDRMADLQTRGGTTLPSAREAVSDVGSVVLSLPSSEIVRDVCIGPDGIADALAPGALIVDTTTARPEDSVALAERLLELGIGFVDASISGTSSRVADRDVVMMVGGAPGDVARARPVLDAIARSVHHLGPVGAGARAKLIVNLVLGIHRLVLAEGLVLGERAGLEPGSLLEVLRDGAAYSKAMDVWGPRMTTGRFDPPSSRIRQHHKDVGLMLELGERARTELPLTRVLDATLREAEAMGLSDEDLSILVDVVRRAERPAGGTT